MTSSSYADKTGCKKNRYTSIEPKKKKSQSKKWINRWRSTATWNRFIQALGLAELRANDVDISTHKNLHRQFIGERVPGRGGAGVEQLVKLNYGKLARVKRLEVQVPTASWRAAEIYRERNKAERVLLTLRDVLYIHRNVWICVCVCVYNRVPTVTMHEGRMREETNGWMDVRRARNGRRGKHKLRWGTDYEAESRLSLLEPSWPADPACTKRRDSCARARARQISLVFYLFLSVSLFWLLRDSQESNTLLCWY